MLQMVSMEVVKRNQEKEVEQREKIKSLKMQLRQGIAEGAEEQQAELEEPDELEDEEQVVRKRKAEFSSRPPVGQSKGAAGKAGAAFLEEDVQVAGPPVVFAQPAEQVMAQPAAAAPIATGPQNPPERPQQEIPRNGRQPKKSGGCCVVF